jgi:hypothetical protein
LASLAARGGCAPVAEQDKRVLADLIQLYRYDLPEIRGYDLTAHGTFIYRYLDHYFLEDSREACFITAIDALAGFTLTGRLGRRHPRGQ